MSATYHLRGTSANMECVVIFLDSSSATFNVNAQCSGQQLYEKVINHLDSINAPARIRRELFGLQYKDNDEANKWLKLNKKLRKQLGGGPDYILEFKVRFFLEEPHTMLDRLSCKMYFLQIRTMLQQGVLKPRNNDAAFVGALVAQLELGDWREIYSDYSGPDYLHQIIIYPEQERKPDLLMRISEAYQDLRGISEEEAERRLLEEVSKIDRYGIEMHYAKSIIDAHILDTFERPDTLIEIGVSSHRGITVYKNGIKEEKDLHWQLIDKIICEGKQFNLCFQAESGPNEYFKMSFNFSTIKSCKGCYDSCRAHHQFFQDHQQDTTSAGGGVIVGTEFTCRPSNTFKRSLLKIGNPARKSGRSLAGSSASGVSIRSSSFISSSQAGSSNRNSYSTVGHSAAGSSSAGGGGGAYACASGISALNISTGQDPFPAMPCSSHHYGDGILRTHSMEYVYPDDYTTYEYDPELDMISPRSTTSLRTIDSEDSDRSYTRIPKGAVPDKPFRPVECNTRSHRYVTLEQSIRDLEYLVENDRSFPIQFEMLLSHVKEFTCYESIRPENEEKNRYNDVVPYDRSRVVLKNCRDGGDYINANHLAMISPDATVLHYIAAQGPKEDTVECFWQMIWEQRCSVIVMLTGLVEQDRPKCHQYWPNLRTQMQEGAFVITNDSVETVESYITTREIRLQNLRTPGGCEDTRLIQILQYTTWPDHGCPADASEFLQFVSRVRDYRTSYLDSEQPLLVHCSAGIGRTGVLILMETACSLIEQNQPVEPLEMVKAIREQRPHMIQTSEQFMFVCKAIVRYYQELMMPSAGCSSSGK